MKKILLLLGVFSSAHGFAQDTYLRWAKQFACESPLRYSRGVGIETDDEGNVYTAGIFGGTTDFDPGPAVYNFTPISTDVYISKLDVFGNFVWAKQLQGSLGTLTKSLSVDKDKNIYITGTFQSSVDFDPGPGFHWLTATGTPEIFILKLSPDGELIWVKQIGGLTGDADPYSSALDSQGNLIFTGYYRGQIDFDPGPAVFNLTAAIGGFRDVFICKVDPAGNFIWAGSMGGIEQDNAQGITVDQLDNIYVAGFFRGTADLDPGPAVFNAVSNGIDDIFLLKLNSAGNLIWAKTVGGTGSDQGSKSTTDAAGNSYITGHFRGTVDFDPGPGTYNLSSPGTDAVFILKLDAAGNFSWARHVGGPSNNNRGVDIKLDKLNRVYTTGYFFGPADLDPGPGTFIINSAAIDIFILKLENNGDFLWAKSTGGSGQDQAAGIAIDKFLNIHATGYFSATSDFDLETPVYNLAAIAVSDAFVLKTAQCIETTYDTLNETACMSYTLNGQTYTASGTYRQLLYNSIGCDSIITLNLQIVTEVFTNVNAAICPGQSYYAGGANQTTAGIYRDTIQTSNGCDSIIITNLSLHPKPMPYLGADRNICEDRTDTISPGVFNNYLWHDNSTGPAFVINNSTTQYWVKVTDANNCSETDTLNILSIDTIPRNFLPADQDLCYGSSLKISLPGYADYIWSNGSTDSVISLNSFGSTYLTVTDFSNCVGTDTIRLQRKHCFVIGIPNAFTPNGDTRNDEFKPTILQDVKAFSFIVFNRYGQKVFETKEYGRGWDGTFKGKLQPAGSYVYDIRFTNIFGWETAEKGAVLLIR